MTIKRPGCERRYYDIPEAEVAAVVDQFQAIGEDVDRFKAFLSAAEARLQCEVAKGPRSDAKKVAVGSISP